jgi:hypothetical protein
MEKTHEYTDAPSSMEPLLPEEGMRDLEDRVGRLLKETFPLLREALLAGSFDRGKATVITGYQERQARKVLSSLLEKELLVYNSPKGAVNLGFPIDVVERWFPKLYPAS